MRTTSQNKDYVAKLIAKAQSAMDAGFTSEAARKECMTYCLSRAFEYGVDEALRNIMLDERDARGGASNTTNPLYWEIPAIANWRSKHNTKFGAPEFEEPVKLANLLVAMRDNCKALPLVPKTKKVTKEEANRIAHGKTCQICGRPILAETGVIAHHGYERPGYGWQTASCYGARHLPFEVSRDVLGDYITKILDVQIKRMIAERKSAAQEETPVTLSYAVWDKVPEEERRWGQPTTVKRDVYFEVTRRTFAKAVAEHGDNCHALQTHFDGKHFNKPSFQAVLDNDLRQRDSNIKNWKEQRVFQQQRFDAWKPAK